MAMPEETQTEFSGGFAPFIRADGDVTVREAGAMAIVAGGNADIKEGGAGLCVVGGDLSISQGGAGNMIVGGSAELSEAAVGQMAALNASATDSRIGVLVAGQATLERSEILLSTEQAIGFGVAAGLVFFLLSKLFGRN
jgi:hypothetical protein